MINQGLTSEEAAKLLEQFGKNEIISGHKIRPLEIFISQFKSFLILILFIAAILASLAGEKLDTIVIIVIIVLNSIFWFYPGISC